MDSQTGEEPLAPVLLIMMEHLVPAVNDNRFLNSFNKLIVLTMSLSQAGQEKGQTYMPTIAGNVKMR